MEKPLLSDSMFLDSNGMLLYDFEIDEQEIEESSTFCGSIFLEDGDMDQEQLESIHRIQTTL